MRLYVQDERQLYNKQPCESRTRADAELTVPKHLHLPKKKKKENLLKEKQETSHM